MCQFLATDFDMQNASQSLPKGDTASQAELSKYF